jgi:hypothetical protein
MNRAVTQLLGVVVLAFTNACEKATTAASTANMPGPSFQWYEQLPPPGTLSAAVLNDPEFPNNGYGYFNATTQVSGGSGTYTYRWYVRECSWNEGAEWCPSWYVDTYETGSALTWWISASATTVYFVVEVQEVTSNNTPASGVATAFVAGPYFEAEGSSGNNPFCGNLMAAGGYPLSRRELNPNNQQYEWLDYRRNQCSGAVEWDPYN